MRKQTPPPGRAHLLPRPHHLRAFTTSGAGSPAGDPALLPVVAAARSHDVPACRGCIPSAIAARPPPPQTCWHFTAAPGRGLLSLVFPQLLPTPVPGEGRAPSPRGTRSPVRRLCAVMSRRRCHRHHRHCSALGLAAQAGPSCRCTVPTLCK